MAAAAARPRASWAAGQYGNITGGTEVILNQILRWNGTKWAKVPVPNPAGTAPGDASALYGVRCTSPGSCWAAGTSGTQSNPDTFLNEVLHWNGSAWSLVSTPDPAGLTDGDSNQLSGVRCASAGNCWAVGDEQAVGGAQLNEALHWNGSTWSIG